MALKILIIDDHEMFRDGLQLLVTGLNDVLMECTDVYLASTRQEAIDLSTRYNDIGLVLLDLNIPGNHALNTLETLREILPLAAIIVISAIDKRYIVRQVIAQGADGFIAKSSATSVIFDAITQVLNGAIVTIFEDNLTEPEVHFSPRLIQTIALLEKGYSNKQIGKELNISDSTAREYVSEILRLLTVENRVQAVVHARKLGLILD